CAQSAASQNNTKKQKASSLKLIVFFDYSKSLSKKTMTLRDVFTAIYLVKQICTELIKEVNQ
ncbi:MAG: hypothetical protein WBM32_02710, partial [Crocosphaera sp.]